MVVFSAVDLKVDNSSLTGESEPQERMALFTGSSNRPVEAENLVNSLQGYYDCRKVDSLFFWNRSSIQR